ncbi:MAG: hypothetical protein Q8N77_03200, partial [Nanoarchaeota archaeon]|nr:hypothetical protein [Nanoarchaeota archaeon]
LYADFWFDRTGAKKGMGVYLRSNTSQDELRALVLGSDDYNSYADGYGDLRSLARFVSGAQ